MERTSTLKFLGLPDTFGYLLLVLGLILVIAPYAGGSDFGLFKVPDFGPTAKRRLRLIGPALLATFVFLFFPLWLSPQSVLVLPNPFGDQQILLNGKQLLIPTNALEQKDERNRFVSQKYLFGISLPPETSGLKHELLSAGDYSRLLDPKGGGFSNPFVKIGLPDFLIDAKVFRIYRPQPHVIKTNPSSYEGPRASEVLREQAQDQMTGQLGAALKEMQEKLEIQNEEVPALKKEDTQKVLKELQALQAAFGSSEFQLFNELSILIVDRHAYEKSLIASNRGRMIEATPLNFMLSAGGTLPYFDVFSVTTAAISRDNRVWGFYGRRQFGNVEVDGVLVQEVYYDYYRLYVINAAYIYQITLNYIPGPSHPRTTWDDLVDVLASLRIVS